MRSDHMGLHRLHIESNGHFSLYMKFIIIKFWLSGLHTHRIILKAAVQVPAHASGLWTNAQMQDHGLNKWVPGYHDLIFA